MTRRSMMSIGALAIAFFAGCTTAMMEGRSALRQGHYEDAATYFTQALARDPGWLDALIGLGVTKYKLAEYDEAIDALERVVAREPRQAPAHLYLALSHFRRGEYGPVEEHLKAVSELTPGRRADRSRVALDARQRPALRRHARVRGRQPRERDRARA